jgi:hypothetical protein
MDSRLEELKQAVQSAVESLSSEQLTWHPPDKWCAAEILEHLYLTYSGTIKGFTKVLEAGKPLATRSSMIHWMRTIAVVRFRYMPEGRQAPANTRPKGLPGVNVRGEVGAKIMEMDAIIAQCEARFGRSRRLLDHPILGPLTASQWRTFHFVHGRHHVKQILRLCETMKPIG